VSLRRLALLLSALASAVTIVAVVDDWQRPLLWLAAAVLLIAVAGLEER
jgi:hypothetical protein